MHSIDNKEDSRNLSREMERSVGNFFLTLTPLWELPGSAKLPKVRYCIPGTYVAKPVGP